jgi:hypothetical protein
LPCNKAQSHLYPYTEGIATIEDIAATEGIATTKRIAATKGIAAIGTTKRQ